MADSPTNNDTSEVNKPSEKEIIISELAEVDKLLAEIDQQIAGLGYQKERLNVLAKVFREQTGGEVQTEFELFTEDE
tara:strand:- start:22 stop:252 length:231 start_codon:yes stop_codon:yes gene_type:complete